MTTEKPVGVDSSGGSADDRPATSSTASATATRPSGRLAGLRGRWGRAPLWQQSVAVVVIAVVAAVVVKALFLQVFTVPTASMEPTLSEGGRVVVAKPPYWFGSGPSRGDVVVFKDPGGWLGNSSRDDSSALTSVLSAIGLDSSGGYLVKRVIGVGGDTVTCCDAQHRLEVNGYSLDEKGYTSSTYPDGTTIPCAGPMYDNCTWTSGVIPKGTVFVMGDDRGNSSDSTAHLECLGGGAETTTSCTDTPFVPDSSIVGKVVARGNLSFLSTPSDFSHIPDPN